MTEVGNAGAGRLDLFHDEPCAQGLYCGITADLSARVAQHQGGTGSDFCRRYRLTRLVLAEHHDSIDDAIRREKLLKTWKRAWKIALIEASNPEWRELHDDLIGA